MSESDKVFAGSIPENYDRYLVPLIFESFAADISQRAVALSPKAVLETAAGSGVVTRALAPKLSPDAKYVVTDLNQAMLDYAATRMHKHCRLKTPASTSFVASLAPCFSPIAHRAIGRPSGFSSAADGSCSTYGIVSRRMYSPMIRRTHSRNYFQTILPAFWRERRTAITIPR
jgi:hypothetical protein